MNRICIAALTLTWLACGPSVPGFPEPEAWSTRGPGGPTVLFNDTDLLSHCAYLTGGAEDHEHHNLVVMHDGYLLMPWAPEDASGGISFFEFDDPCNPIKIGEGYDIGMRESHTMAFGTVGGREYLAVDYQIADDAGGIGFWDITEPTAPVWVSELELPDYSYPDAYFRVALSTFWQGDMLYVSAGLNGVFVVDVTDPLSPELIHQHREVGHLVGSFHVIGNLAMSSSAGLAQTFLYDMSDPLGFDPIPGGDWLTQDQDGGQANYYFANIGGRYALFARKDTGGGPVVYDIGGPDAPSFVSDLNQEDADGGYVFRQNDHLFQGESNFSAVYDFCDPYAPHEIARIELVGDLDTLTPVGNIAVASVDDDANPGQSSAVVPWQKEPDTMGPRLELTSPSDEEHWVALTSRIGLSFDEMLESRSVHAGSLRVWSTDGDAVPGRFYTQENIVNFVPDFELSPDTTYVVHIPVDGIADVTGNPTTRSWSFRFTTGGELETE